MFVNLYTDNLYSQKIRINDQTLYGAHAEPTISTRTIGEVEYKYFKNLLVYDPLGAAGTIIANAVTDPAGDANNYKSFYLIGGNRVDLKNYYDIDPNNPEQWIVTISIRLIVSGIEIDTMGLIRPVATDPATQPYYYNISFASLIVDGTLYYGFVYSDSPDTYCQLIAISQNFYEQSIAKPYDGGAAGSDPSSGYGDNDTDTDSISRIGSLNGVLASANGHGLHVYEMDASAYSDFLDKLYSKYLLISAVRTFLSPEDALVSLHMLPTLTRSQTAVSSVNVGALFSVPLSGTIKADSTNVYTVDSGEIPVGTVLNDFLDYVDTKAVLYMPFCGFAPIDIQDIMAGAIRVIYEIDVIQGNCAANVYTYNYQGREKIQGIYSGNCAYRLPLSGSKDGSGLITGLITTAAGAAIGKVDMAVSGGLAAAEAVQSSIGSTVWSSGQAGSNSAYYSDTNCQLIVYRPNGVYPDTYAAAQGRPTGDGLTVGRYKGFLSGIVHADISGATAEEKEKIEQMIERGIVI